MTWEEWHITSGDEAEYFGVRETYHFQPCDVCGRETTYVELSTRRPLCGPQCWVTN